MVRFDFSRAIELLKAAKTVALCGHKNPDGDCLGSILALASILNDAGIQATPLLANPYQPKDLAFLEGYDTLVAAGDYKGNPDVFVMVDVPNDERMLDGAAVKARAKVSIKIDHHAGPDDVADLCYIDESAAAAGMLVWELAGQMCNERSASVAQNCYAALLTDTGSFRFQNADADAFAAAAQMVAAGADPAFVATEVYQRKSLASLRLSSRVADRARFECEGRLVISWMDDADLAELGATKEDCEDLIDVVRQIDGPEVCVVLRGQADSIRGSIRSKSGHDVRAIAMQMNGGGHVAASGFTLYGDMEQAIAEVIERVAASFEPVATQIAQEGCR